MRFFLFQVCFYTAIFSEAISQSNFRAISETKQALSGSSFRVEFRLENEEGKQFAPPDFGGLQIVSGPSRSMQTSVINGRTSFSVGYVYILAGTKPGKYRIGPATILVGSKMKRTDPMEIEIVAQQSKAGQFRDFFIRAEISSRQAYVGQQLLLKYRIYTRVNVTNIDVVSSPKLEAFYREHIATGDGQPHRVIENGVEYFTKVLGIQALYPMKPGKIKIEPSAFRVILGDEDSWGFGLHSMFSQRAEVVQTNDCIIDVKDFPKPMPDGFNGATGFFTSQLEQPARDFTMSDAIQFHMTITGTGHFASIKHRLNIPDSLFQIAEGKATQPVRIADDSLIVQQVKSTYLLTPKQPGFFQLYPEFVYLDPSTGQYVTKRDTIRLNVSQGSLIQTGEPDSPPLLTDFSLSKSETELIKNPMFWPLVLFPWILMGILWASPKIKSKWIKGEKDFNKPNRTDNANPQEKAELYLIQLLQSNYPEVRNLRGLNAIKIQLQNSKVLLPEHLQLIRKFELLKYQPMVTDDQWNQFMREF
ncbi:MAG: protein BatD [Saprospiraceae bacterium]|nr:protein BatD [Saprospiraceae bacterium]